jgi:hypothetical protein
MRCCALPTTSIAEAPPAVGVAPSAALPHDARAAFDALLVGMVLRPIAKPLGFYGEIVVDTCAAAIARALASPRAGSPPWAP